MIDHVIRATPFSGMVGGRLNSEGLRLI